MAKKQKSYTTTVDSSLNGDAPKMATVQDFMGASPPYSGRHMAMRSTKNKVVGPKTPPKINLKAVAEALIDEGLDPATEIARVLRGRPMLDDDGKPVIDPVTGHELMEHMIDAETRLRTLNSLLEFTQPKLKAVEVKMSGSLELTGEQLDQRLQMLLAKAQK